MKIFRIYKWYLFFLIIGLFVYINVYVYITNPYNPISIVKSPFTTTVENNQIVLHKNFSLNVGENEFQKLFAFYKSGLHILANTYFGSTPAKSKNEEGIINDIHSLRFNPLKPYLISGDHFSVLYPRNLGIFYSEILNPNTALSKSDWLNRQRIYIQTTAYALESFTKFNNLSTTIVPIGFQTVAPINIFAYPSDSLYGVLYALDVLKSNYYPDNKFYPLQTVNAAKELIITYHSSLRKLLQKYIANVYDSKNGIIKKDIHLSSERDSVIRESSFYDNVIFWKTLSLASNLDIKHYENNYLNDLKENIIKKFWNDKDGYFLNDLSKNKEYSSDWLIAVNTGFLNVNNQTDLVYIKKSVNYIIANSVDKPFGLRLQKNLEKSAEFPVVGLFVPSYGENAIWSYWGVSYIKTLLLLFAETHDQLYLAKAEQNIARYDKNIIDNKGFPEVYDNEGNFLQNIFYKSVRQTGWVVNFEDVKWRLQKIILEDNDSKTTK